MGGDAADAVPAGIKALRAFAKAPSHLVSAPVSRHDPRARRPPLFSSQSTDARLARRRLYSVPCVQLVV